MSSPPAGALLYHCRKVRPMAPIDYALRALFLFAGVLSAIVLTVKGQGQALAPLAIGATLGVFAMRVGTSEE